MRQHEKCAQPEVMKSHDTLTGFIREAPLLRWHRLPQEEWEALTEENYSGSVELFCHDCKKERIFTFVGKEKKTRTNSSGPSTTFTVGGDADQVVTESPNMPITGGEHVSVSVSMVKSEIQFQNDSPTIVAAVLQCVNPECGAELKFVFERDTVVRTKDETEEAQKIVRKLYHEPTYRTLYGKSPFIEAFSDEFESVDRDNLKRADECFRDGYPAAALVYLRKFIESLIQEIYEANNDGDYIEWQSKDGGQSYEEQFAELGEHMPDSLRKHGQEVLQKVGSGLHLTYSEEECEKIYDSAVTFIVEVMKEMYGEQLQEDFHVPQDDLEVLVDDL
jgi:hypothetical protein